jgi:hypothetical protein
VSDGKNILDDQLRQALEGLEGNVGMSAWDAIEGSLDRSERRKKFFLYFAIASVLVLIGGISWYTSTNNSNPEALPLVEEQTNTVIAKDDAAPVFEEPINNTDDAVDTETTAINKTTDGSAVTTPIVSPMEPDSKKEVASEGTNNPRIEDKGDKQNLPTIKTDSSRKSIVKEEQPKAPKNPADSVNKNPETPAIIKDPIASNVPDSTGQDKDQSANTNGSNNNKQNLKGSFEFGLTFNTALITQVFSENTDEGYKLHPRYLDIQKNSTRASAGYVIKLNALYYLNESVYVSSGISLTQKEENVNYDFLIKYGIHLDENNRTYNPIEFPLDVLDYKTVKFNNTNTYHFVEIPVRIGKLVEVNSKLQIRAEAGISYMVRLGSTGSTIDASYLELRNLDDNQFLKRHVLGAGFKAGVYFTPDSYWRFGVEPGFETSINSIYNKESAVKFKPYNYGLHFTANYILQKK